MKKKLPEMKESNALFSKDGEHRYALIRIWDETKPKVMFVGLNPSKAGERNNDKTITKVIKIADNNGFGGLYMMNLFSFITPYPEQLQICQATNNINNEYLLKYAQLSEKVVFCWGNFRQTGLRKSELMCMFPKSYCLFRNKNDSPKHPLYCKDESQIIYYR